MFCKYVYSIIHQFVYTTLTVVHKIRQNMYGLREFTACMSNYSAGFFSTLPPRIFMLSRLLLIQLNAQIDCSRKMLNLR